jgi:hypothetical protein
MGQIEAQHLAVAKIDGSGRPITADFGQSGSRLHFYDLVEGDGDVAAGPDSISFESKTSRHGITSLVELKIEC